MNPITMARLAAGPVAVFAALAVAACGSSVSSGSGGAAPHAASAPSSAPAGGARAQSLLGTSSAPVRCGPNHELDNCYSYDQMQQLADVIIPMVQQFFDASYATHRAPSAYYYVANGVTGQEACTDPATGQQHTYSSQSYEYCPADNDVYLGQDMLWFLYSNFGAVSVAAGIAHEDIHEDQNFVGVPEPQTQVDSINLEDQADCGAGAWAAYGNQQGWLEYSDFQHLGPFLAAIADAEGPSQIHGTEVQRTEWFNEGFKDGLGGCDQIFPNTPLLNP
jgi:hypothetical protein